MWNTYNKSSEFQNAKLRQYNTGVKHTSILYIQTFIIADRREIKAWKKRRNAENLQV